MEAKILSNSVKAVTRGTRLPDNLRMLPQQLCLMPRRLAKVLLLLCCLPFACIAQATIVEIQSSPGLIASAEYRTGSTEKPAVLVLHGFLQTREFGTTKSIADALADEGYAVLTPNLTLGISHRKRSLDCEALHLHDMSGDIREIQQWVQWLRNRGHSKIIAIGHSFGAVQLLAWREHYRERNFPLIGISLIGSAPFTMEKKPAQPAESVVARKPAGGLAHLPLSFCESYASPKDKRASYLRWDENRILAALEHGGSRTDVILGSEDKYLPADWATRLAKAGAKTRQIAGASHFMDGSQEFDMLDAILSILKR